MEFNERLQELRKQKGLTQEELAGKLYVTRTAISKWESGRGYPNIDSLRAIAAFFSVTIDELLSSNEAIMLAEENEKRMEKNSKALIFSLVDIAAILLFFLPFFASRADDVIKITSLLMLDAAPIYIKIPYFLLTGALTVMGITALVLKWRGVMQNSCNVVISLALSGTAVLLFTVTLQPYAAVYAFALLTIKATMLFKRK